MGREEGKLCHLAQQGGEVGQGGEVLFGKQGAEIVDSHGDALYEVCLVLEVATVAIGSEYLQGAEEHEVAQATGKDLFVKRAVAHGRAQILCYQLLAHRGGEAGTGLPEERH